MKSNAVAGSLCIFVGCACVGPDYERPSLTTPGVMPELAPVASDEPDVRFAPDEPAERWWTIFHDERLERLVDDALSGNQDLRAAVARVHASRAVVSQAFAPLLPQVGAFGWYRYAKLPPNAFPSSSTGQSPFGGAPFQSWLGVLDMTYEVDLWGKIRRGLEAADASEAATEEDRKNVEITLVAEVASAYFDLGRAEADLTIAEEAVAVREKTVDLLNERFLGGVVPELDVHRARAELERARAQVPDARRRRAVAEHRLAVLLGYFPVVHLEGRPPACFDLPPELPVGLPATLLERRPDIRAAEQRLRAANARIGESEGDYFPSLKIFGAFGYATVDLWKIANPESQLFAIGPSVSIPIFQGGRVHAQVEEARAHTDEATAGYYQAVLTAFQEVADAVVGIQASSRMRDAQKKNVAESERAHELVTEQYEKGTTNYLNVLDAQRTLLDARQALVQAQRDVLASVVQLEKALGGGWAPERDTAGERGPGSR